MIIHSPKIITDGLVLLLDAGNKKSYSGSGTSWLDLSLSKKTGTIYNSTLYDSNFRGSFVFEDTSFDYATVPNIGSLTNFTVEAWARTNKLLNSKVTSIVCNQYDLISNLNFSLGTNNSPTNYNMTFGFYNGAWRNVAGFSMAVNTWYHLVGTYDGFTIILYVNGVLNSQTSYSGTAASGGEIRIARRWDDVANVSSNFFSGNISSVKIYNRALSLSEISQNFQNQRTRFNL